MYRNNYLIKTQSGIYKNRKAIYKSGAWSPDLIAPESYVYTPLDLLDNSIGATKINFYTGSKIPALSIRIKDA